MTLSRRQFTVLTGAAAAALLGSAPAASLARSSRRAAAPTWFEWKKLAEGAWVGIGEGGNTLLLADSGECILVDTKNPGFADVLWREAQAQSPDAKLVRIINTHHHADHTGGNYAFTPATPILAHEKAKPRIESQIARYKERLAGAPTQVGRSERPGAKELVEDLTKLAEKAQTFDAAKFAPTETINGQHEIKVGSRRVVLHHFGPGHTDNDLVLHVPDLNLIHTGDLVFNGRHPFMDASAGATSLGWGMSLAKILELGDDKTIVIPGHGDVGSPEIVRKQAQYFKAARAAVEKAIAEAKTREATTQISVAELDALGADRKAATLGFIFDEMTR